MNHNNILLITPFAPPNSGGAESHLKDLYNYLNKNGYRITLLTYQPLTTKAKGLPYEKIKNLTIYRYNWPGYNLFTIFEKFPPLFNFLYLTPYLLIRSIFYMIKHTQETDIVHAFGLNAAFIARILKIFFKKKIIMSTEALYNFNKESFFGKVAFWVLKGFDQVLAGSLDSKIDLLNLGLPKNKIIVYTHWINLDYFKPGDKIKLKKKLGWENKFTVLYVGRLIEQKGIRLILDIAKKTKKDLNFKIIGDDSPELANVKKAEAENNKIKHIGRIPNYELQPYYAAADVFVYPALYKEDLALVLLESMACGTPVINTNKGSGIYELNDKVAFVTKPNAQKIQEKIEYLYENPELQKTMSRNCVQFAVKFGPKLGKIITATYERATNQD